MGGRLKRNSRLLKKLNPQIFRTVESSMHTANYIQTVASMVLASGTGDANGEGDCFGDDYRGFSHFQKTVCLYDWWLIISDKEFQGKKLAVAGSTGREPVRLFTSAAITKRHDSFSLETADGICVVLQGFINKPRTEENGFSSGVFNHFVFGFPRRWEYCYQRFLKKEDMKETESEGVTDFAMPGTGLAVSSPSSSSSKFEVFGEDKHNSDVNVDSSGIVAEKIIVEERLDVPHDIPCATTPTQERKGNQSIISPESLNCKRTRSGRIVLPPLDFWRNQVAVFDVDRNITGIQDVNPVKLSGTKSKPRRKS